MQYAYPRYFVTHLQCWPDYMSPDPNSKGLGMRLGDAMPVDWLIFYLKLIERVLILANLNVSENEVNQHK